MTPDRLYLWCIGLVVLSLLMLALSLVLRGVQRQRGHDVIDRAIERAANAVPPTDAPAEADPTWTSPHDDLPAHWLQSRLGRLLVADEDRRLIDQCGWPATRAQLLFLGARLSLAVLLPLGGLLLMEAGYWRDKPMLVLAIAFAVGVLLPKWVLSALAKGQREQVANELPLFVDLLRLLQGVGLSLDQSLQIMSSDFGHVLRSLGREIEFANSQYARGRTREHSLQRLATVHRNEDLASLVGLLVQIDRHGGAVQEPLRLFSERLRERRRADLKARIGKTTVKMTAVMVTTLLPALLVVAAGPGFLAVIRSLGEMSK